MAYRGKFQPENPNKYRGHVNNITWRSTWELRFMRFLDTNPAVLEWSSEELTIPYISPLDNCIHRYIPDFYMKTKEADSTITRTIIEIKPEKQTVQPKLQKKMTPRYLTEVKTWGVNSAKWAAAERYCDDLGWKFMKITEKELFRE